MKLDLDDQVVIVTGGASGIGWACCKQFLEEGARVHVWDLAPPDEARLKELNNLDRSKLSVTQVDIAQESEIQNALDKTAALQGEVQHLVHAAAIGSGKFGFPFTNLVPSDWSKTIAINILGTVNVCHAVAPVLRSQNNGSICLIGSVAGQIGSQTDPPYSASKAANINFMQCMAKDLAPHSVRVNVVNPGMVQTPLNRGVWKAWNDQQPTEKQLSYEEWAGEKINKVVPLGRWQSVEDIANMVTFLASDRARNVTGQCINVDGGFVMHW